MLGIYSLAVMVGIPVVPIGIGFGALFALAITGAVDLAAPSLIFNAGFNRR